MISSNLIVKAIQENIKSGKDNDSFADDLLLYLKENHLLFLLPNILNKLEKEKEKEEKANTIEVLTSHEFDSDILEKIKGYIKKEKGDKFKTVVDDKLIAGFVIKGKNRILDASLRRNIQFLRESLIK
ncbi:MAG: F0F1 ATP synthase subunit delta [Candidatus Paceibacterota bacterium]